MQQAWCCSNGMPARQAGHHRRPRGQGESPKGSGGYACTRWGFHMAQAACTGQAMGTQGCPAERGVHWQWHRTGLQWVRQRCSALPVQGCVGARVGAQGGSKTASLTAWCCHLWCLLLMCLFVRIVEQRLAAGTAQHRTPLLAWQCTACCRCCLWCCCWWWCLCSGIFRACSNRVG